jgi:hypothetical protein
MLFFEYFAVHRLHSTPSNVFSPLSHLRIIHESRPSKAGSFHCSGQNSPRSCDGAVPKQLLDVGFASVQKKNIHQFLSWIELDAGEFGLKLRCCAFSKAKSIWNSMYVSMENICGILGNLVSLKILQHISRTAFYP